ncbi:MAG: UDP-N-acetylglucosamine--N-acetylmuramyl-(pentapeptide) pyrophosphoryl-undecaprenol N-acetylglucosamine transferase [Myxococcota bacterium]|nr:UDP-N-acetylglucosamine--N-acetylmuramyl-(pentapeptide) pyrophosphoryl-undecaprenol N-acetylglucosamine transferase [Myxococcota bacterium]
MNRESAHTLMIAGGGTGGHLYPGVAVAEEFCARAPGNRVVFAGTRRGLEARLIPPLGYPLHFVDASGLKGMGASGAMRSLMRLPRSFLQAWSILSRERPAFVVGVGGYASAPLVAAAWLRGAITAIIEPNAEPGLANRLLARVVRRIYIAFPGVSAAFPARRTLYTGTPLRKSILGLAPGEKTARDPSGRLRLLITGGSQGARRLNEITVETLRVLGDEREGFDVWHQTGANDHGRILQLYKDHGTGVRVDAFIDPMSEAYRWADLAISRAGAGTVSELAAAGLPAILVPFPYAADNHQEKNAAEIAAAGGAIMFREADLTAEGLASALRGLRANPDRLREMSRRAASLGKPGAAAEIVDDLLRLGGGN